MEIKTNVTVNLSEDDVKQILADYVHKKTGYEIRTDDVTLSVGSRIEGYGMGEYSVEYFKGAYVNCKEK